MKRLFLIAALTILCILVFCSCSSNEEDYSENINSNFCSSAEDKNEQNSTNAKDDNSTLDSSTVDKNEEAQNDVEINEIVLTTDDVENVYYPIIQNAVFNSEYVEFYNIEGCYFQIISSYEEYNKIINSPSNVDPLVFEENYVLCISRAAGIGYYDFEYLNGRYSISVDSYYPYGQSGAQSEPEFIFTSQSVDFVVIPKTECECFDGFREITVNKVEKSRVSLEFGEHDSNVALPEKLQAWKMNEFLAKKYGLTFDIAKNDYANSILIFLPQNPTSDFLITQSRTENGKLYLTVEKYTDYQNSYLKSNAVKFYLLRDIDSEALDENFSVYVTVKAVGSPFVPTVEIPVNIDVADAILIAQDHFFKTFAKELPDGYIYTAKYTTENEKYWGISIFDKCIGEDSTGRIDDDYNYFIDKVNGEIIRIETVDKTPLTEAEARIVVENYLKEIRPELINDVSITIFQYVENEYYLAVATSSTQKIGFLVDRYSMQLTEVYIPE